MTEITPLSDLDRRRAEIATACRVLAARDLAPGILGHISVRVATNGVLVRCRGPRERGLAFTEPSDIHLVDLDGNPGMAGELAGGYTVPNELALHTEILRTRENVHAVVHAHPADIVAADLAGIAVRPIVGAFDIPGTQLAAGGIPVYPRGVLIRNRNLATEMVTAMGERPAVILRAHGLTSTGATVEQAVLRAISINQLAALCLSVHQAGGILTDLPEADMAELPDLGEGFNQEMAWRHEVAKLPSVLGG